MDQREALERIFRAGITACQPALLLPPALPEPPRGRTIVLSIGKAAATMAATVEAQWHGPLEGLAVAPHGTRAVLDRIALLTAAHPVPDAASVAAAERLLALACEAGPDDLVLALLSGGASSLACLPNEGVTLAAKQELVAGLLRSGAPIGAINCARRHLSGIKGGRLGAAAQPARLVTLAISDVAGDRPHDIGSGPTVGDPTTCAEARAILAAHRLPQPPQWSDSVSLAEAAQWQADYRIVASGRIAVDVAAAEAERLGYSPRIIGYEMAGEAKEVAAAHAAAVRQALGSRERVALLSGGEATVAVRGSGRGGPNREFALVLAAALAGTSGWATLAADSDGIDGSGPAAGAFAYPTSIGRAAAIGLDHDRALAENDSGAFFAAIGDALITGPTGTNVNDLRIILIDPFASAAVAAKAPG